MQTAGLPLHALVVHAAVVLIPLTTLLAIAFAVLPRWRWLVRWPVAVASVLCIGLAFLATTSGESLEESRHLQQLVAVHQERGNLLARLTIPFAVLVLLCAYVLPGPSGLVSGKGGWRGRIPVLETVLVPLLVLAAVGIIVLVVLVGDSGARAVWG